MLNINHLCIIICKALDLKEASDQNLILTALKSLPLKTEHHYRINPDDLTIESIKIIKDFPAEYFITYPEKMLSYENLYFYIY